LETAFVVGGEVVWPILKAETRTLVSNELAVLDLVLQPAKLKHGPELVKEVTTFLAMFPFGTRFDALHTQAKIDGWCSGLEDMPMYAIKRALDWWKKYGKREPSFAEVLEDVKLYCGRNVLTRRKLLQEMLANG